MAFEIKKILFATDLSEDARGVFEHALGLANQFHAGIVILHVLEGTSAVQDKMLLNIIGQEKLDEIKEKNRAEAHDKLIGKARDGRMVHQAIDSFCADAAAGMGECHFETEILILEGKVDEVIMDTAKENGCDLIVLGHYHRGILKRGPLTSVTSGVARKSKIPVLLVPVLD